MKYISIVNTIFSLTKYGFNLRGKKMGKTHCREPCPERERREAEQFSGLLVIPEAVGVSKIPNQFSGVIFPFAGY